MKRIALISAVVALAACSAKEEEATDMSNAAMSDSAMMVDSIARADSLLRDSVMMMMGDSTLIKTDTLQ